MIFSRLCLRTRYLQKPKIIYPLHLAKVTQSFSKTLTISKTTLIFFSKRFDCLLCFPIAFADNAWFQGIVIFDPKVTSSWRDANGIALVKDNMALNQAGLPLGQKHAQLKTRYAVENVFEKFNQTNRDL